MSEIDLARLSVIPAGPRLEQALRAYNAGGGAWSYNPVRSSTPDILAARTPLFGDLEALSWEKIQGQIKTACRRGIVQQDANVEVGKALYDAARERGWTAAKEPMGRLPIGIGETVQYWCDIVVEDANGLFIPYLDHRRGLGIANAPMRQIVFSMQHIWIRERNPDLSDARLALIQFPADGDERTVTVTFHDEAELLSYEELDSRVRTVYDTWARVSVEKVHEPRPTGSTPFGF